MTHTLPSLREVMRTHGITPSKALGQNFLLDQNITDKIVRLAGVGATDHVIEVGPGPGGLTRSILATGARVSAIEKDASLLPVLEELKSAYSDQLNIFQQDALHFNVADAQILDHPLRIVANLPYNVATPLLTGWICKTWPAPFSSKTLMFQKEVADRIVAQPGEKAYGRLAILSQWRMHAHIVMILPPEAFVPPPKVHSAVVHFEPRHDAEDIQPKAVERVTAAAFQQRRKKIRSGLKSLFPDVDTLLPSIGIDPNARAETLPIECFLALAKELQSKYGD